MGCQLLRCLRLPCSEHCSKQRATAEWIARPSNTVCTAGDHSHRCTAPYFCCTFPVAQQAESDRKVETRPSDTLFVVNFDVQRVRERDIERFFDIYGRITRVEIRKNYAFIQVRELWEGTEGGSHS